MTKTATKNKCVLAYRFYAAAIAQIDGAVAVLREANNSMNDALSCDKARRDDLLDSAVAVNETLANLRESLRVRMLEVQDTALAAKEDR